MQHCVQHYSPHIACWGGDVLLVWLHNVSDAAIALSYFTIPVALFYLARKYRVKRIAGVFLVYGLFILGCGLTHVFDVVTVWYANYWVYLADGIVRALTGAASALAAYVTVKCARDALVGFKRLAVLERRLAERQHALETEDRFKGADDQRWAEVVRELRATVHKLTAYAEPESKGG